MNFRQAVTGTIRRMNHIQRYSSLPCLKPENVAAHSWHVAFYAWLIGVDLARRGNRINMASLLGRAVLHDISEVMSGDIIRSYKYGTEEMQRACSDADRLNVARLIREFGEPGAAALGMWDEAKDASLEGDIIRFCDAACVAAYCLEERQLGNTTLDHVMQECYEKVLRPFRSHRHLDVYLRQLWPEDRWEAIYS